MKINTQIIKSFSLFIFLFLSSISIYSQSKSSPKEITYEEITTLFQKLEVYSSLVIQTDLDSMFINKRIENEQPAIISFYGDDQPVLKFKAKIEARGKFRRVKCDIPPLKLNFSKSELAELGLHKKFDKFKLVSHCFFDGSANDALLKEYCVYKMHNHISPYSFRVRPFTIIYQDSKNPWRVIKGECFLLEPNKEMAFRNGGKLVDAIGLTPEDFTAESYHHLIMFNYMIGNTDWNIIAQKNLKYLRKKGVEKLILVPYDFDHSKIVDPPYMSTYTASKRKRRDNRHVTERFHNREALFQELEFFQSLEIYQVAVCNECEKLHRSEKKRMRLYLKPFFKSIKEMKKMQELFLD